MAPPKSAMERRIIRKLDFVLLPFLSILFLFNSLDKSNIGSAESGHFTEDVGLPASALNYAVAAFFAAFVTLQPVGAALGRRYGMARYVPVCMALWGICTALHAAVRKQWQLVLLRTLVGILEAGFYPTTVSYLSLFYTRFEFAKRLGIFYGQAAVAGAFGGLLSWAVFKHFPDPRYPSTLLTPRDTRIIRDPPLKSWQVLFLIEGLCTVLIAVLGFFWLPHNAGSAWFFTPEERLCAEARIRVDRAETHVQDDDEEGDAEQGDEQAAKPDSDDEEADEDRHASIATQSSFNSYAEDHGLLRTTSYPASLSSHSPTDDRGLNRVDIISAFTDWKVWYLLVCNILSAVPATAFSVFLPVVIKGLTYSNTDMGATGEMAPATANLLTVPPFVAGAVVLWVFTAWSDKKHERLRPVLWGLMILLVGLAATLLLPRTAYVPRYLALIVLLAGSFVPSPLTVAWLANNTLEPGKRAVVLGINGWGNLAGVLSALLFAPRYRSSGYLLPFFVTLACVGVSCIGFAGFRAAIVATNNIRTNLTGGWDPYRIDREAKHGDVPIDFQDRNWMERLRGVNVPRRGEERLTYQFSL